ncbi:MAG TPA: bifunctional diaminohydroxyphosphoribosylaminopyrimidine deaminase/5-amino-6-(5-phosphoribosylamino)uracil reductase RibD [Terriglobales bacterium]|nr:bifunctional diaminohydroxyphosphoribosylaminopyrimidine deaminase/5-amino-6-(5-phosphoribosylamino)uracil reductase RibD [Terriglobales bacterium]
MNSDEQFVRRALELARAGIGLVSPNPAVGAVIVDPSGQEVGAGTHTYEGVKHAEVIALEYAGGRAHGGTLYLNLEPCSHQGRTSPCVDTVIAAGIRRVVCSMKDPNPQVSGTGFAKLQSAGIQLDVGLLESEARKLNESFAKYIRRGIPFVTLKAAMTLDGKIAPPPAGSRNPSAVAAGGFTGGWITGEIARKHVHELRHQHDAIMAGVGTVIADDPLLTDRSGLPRRRPLLRVILDSFLRLPLTSRLVKTAQNDVLVLYSQADDAKRQELEKLGLQLEQISARDDARPDLADALRHLGKHAITSVIIEGGATVNWTALTSGVVDKLFLYYAPKILGEGSVPFTASAGAPGGHGMLLAKHLALHKFGEDFAVEGYLRDPYGETP